MSLQQQLEKFTPIDLKQMDRVKLLKRTDTKYLLSKTSLIEILPELLEHYCVLEIAGKREASYQTTYLDTEKRDYYFQHHQGKPKRHKVRFRNYIESDLSFLEVKLKHKGVTDKKRISTPFTFPMTAVQETFLQKWIPENALDLKQVLQNTFSRITLVHKTDEERVTIDFNLKFEDQNSKVDLTEPIIIEVKQSGVNRNSRISTLLRAKQIRPQRLSKYCIGCILLDDKLKYNRFKSRLLDLNKIQEIWNF
tara:strand:- start:246 stop:998 length:753 start_codon:yes stop_codon:yes gene_type:complete